MRARHGRAGRATSGVAINVHVPAATRTSRRRSAEFAIRARMAGILSGW